MGSDAGGRYRYTDANAELYGSFGIEGSVWAGLVELAGVAALLWARKRRPV